MSRQQRSVRRRRSLTGRIPPRLLSPVPRLFLSLWGFPKSYCTSRTLWGGPWIPSLSTFVPVPDSGISPHRPIFSRKSGSSFPKEQCEDRSAGFSGAELFESWCTQGLAEMKRCLWDLPQEGGLFCACDSEHGKKKGRASVGYPARSLRWGRSYYLEGTTSLALAFSGSLVSSPSNFRCSSSCTSILTRFLPLNLPASTASESGSSM